MCWFMVRSLCLTWPTLEHLLCRFQNVCVRGGRHHWQGPESDVISASVSARVSNIVCATTIVAVSVNVISHPHRHLRHRQQLRQHHLSFVTGIVAFSINVIAIVIVAVSVNVIAIVILAVSINVSCERRRPRQCRYLTVVTNTCISGAVALHPLYQHRGCNSAADYLPSSDKGQLRPEEL